MPVEYLNREFFEEIETMVTEVAVDLQQFLVDSFVDSKGLAYGDVELSPVERIQKFLDDEMIGVHNELRISAPDEYQKRLRQFQRDVESTGLVEDLVR